MKPRTRKVRRTKSANGKEVTEYQLVIKDHEGDIVYSKWLIPAEMIVFEECNLTAPKSLTDRIDQIGSKYLDLWDCISRPAQMRNASKNKEPKKESVWTAKQLIARSGYLQNMSLLLPGSLSHKVR